MFDLFRRNDKLKQYIMGGLLGIVALSMLLYLIPGAGTSLGGGANGNEDVVADVGDQHITVAEVLRDIDGKLRGQQIAPAYVSVLIPQEIDQMIKDQAVAYEAKRLGLQISDTQLANTIRSFPNVGTMTSQQYRDFLAQQGFTVAQFEDGLRKQQSIVELQNIAVAGAVVTPQEIKATFQKGYEKIKLEYISYNPENLRATLKPSQEELKAYFERNKGFFSVPETRSFIMLVGDPAKMAETIQVSDAQIQAYYDAHRDIYHTPERAHVRHILFETANKPKDEQDKIKARAQDVLKQLKSGGDFAKLAKENSGDPGTKDKGGDLGWVTRGQMVKNFENASFTQKVGEIGDLVSTEYGYHIVQVLERQEPRTQSLDEVKNNIANDLKKGSVNDKLQNAIDDARAALVKAPQNAEQIASKYNLILTRVDNHKSNDTIPELGVDQQVDGALTALKKGDVSQVIQTKSNKLVVVECTAVIASHPAQYEEMRGEVAVKYFADTTTTMAQDKAKKAMEMLRSNGGDLQAVAKALGGEVKTTDLFTRGGAAEGLGSGALLSEAFNHKVGDVVGPIGVTNQQVVAKLVDKVEPDEKELASKRDQIVQQIQGQKAQERAMLFEDGLIERLKKDGKIKTHQDVVQKLMQRYRG
jgi:peptidyl-prolyl cis-trans isomerase D